MQRWQTSLCIKPIISTLLGQLRYNYYYTSMTTIIPPTIVLYYTSMTTIIPPTNILYHDIIPPRLLLYLLLLFYIIIYLHDYYYTAYYYSITYYTSMKLKKKMFNSVIWHFVSVAHRTDLMSCCFRSSHYRTEYRLL